MLRTRFVESVRAVVPALGAAHERLPDGRTTLVFRGFADGGGGDLCAIGPGTRAHVKPITGLARAVTVQLAPGCAATLLGVPASALTDRIVALDRLWGRAGGELCTALLEAPTPALAADLLCRAVEARRVRASQPARLVRLATQMFEAEQVRVAQVAAELGVTTRHLRRAFLEHVGVGPKEFARAARLRRALHLVGRAPDWSRIAIDAGYFDQAHLIAEFHALIGCTPTAYLRSRAADRATPSDASPKPAAVTPTAAMSRSSRCGTMLATNAPPKKHATT